MPFEDVAFQLIDLPPLSDQHIDPWVFDVIRAADIAWVVLDGRYPLEGMDDTERLLAERKVTLRPAGSDRASIESTEATNKPALVVLTGADRTEVADAVPILDDLFNHRWPLTAVSSTARTGFDLLARRTFEALGIIRVYTKQPGKPADRSKPFTLPHGATVADLARRIHKDLLENMKFARVWGKQVFDGQTVQREHVLYEGDVIEVHE
jgi:ribosome-interacting GTPase 1